jgi:predicted GIY-YIG superfamily endonuclease
MASNGSPPTDALGIIYLLHYSGQTAQGRRHYLGWTDDLERRYVEHRRGYGCRETSNAVAQGLKLTLAQTWRGTPRLEMRLRKWFRRHRENFDGICPFCGGGEGLPDTLQRELGDPTSGMRSQPQPSS